MRAAILGFLVWLAASAAGAQPLVLPRVLVSANAGIQPVATVFTEATSDTIYLERSDIDSGYRIPSGALFDVGLGLRVAGRLGVGVAVSRFDRHDTATIQGSVPHPFFFNTPRPISGVDTSGTRQEVGTHLQAIWFVPVRRVDIAVEGGPTFFSVGQDVVTHVSFSESYPYDSAAFAAAQTTHVSDSRVGFNVGGDVGYRVWKTVGFGVLVRYSHASVNLSAPNATTTVKADVGGQQIAGGVRLFF